MRPKSGNWESAAVDSPGAAVATTVVFDGGPATTGGCESDDVGPSESRVYET